MNRPWTAIYASILTSARLASLPDDACRLFYTYLLLVVDSYGSIDARPHVLHAKVWPLLQKPQSETVRAVLELEKAGLIQGHSDDKRAWLSVPDWEEKAGELVRKGRRGPPEYGSTPDNSGSVRDYPGYSGTTPGVSGTTPGASGTTPGDSRIEKERFKKDARETGERKKEEDPEASPRTPEPPEPEPEPAKKPRKEPTGDQATCVKWWCERWLQSRGVEYQPARKDFVAVAAMLKLDGADEVKRRMDRMIGDSDEWMFKKASPTLLVSQWNQYGFEARRKVVGRTAAEIPDL